MVLQKILFCPSAGLCENIYNIFKKDYISTKSHLATEEPAAEPMIANFPAPENEAITEPSTVQYPTHVTEIIPEPSAVQSPTHATEAIPEPNAVQSPTHATETIPGPMSGLIQETRVGESYVPGPHTDMEIEQLRHDETNIGNDNLPEFMHSPARDVHSPSRRDGPTSFSPSSLGTTFGSAALPTPDVAASTGSHGLELETPRTLSEERLDVQSTGLSNIPELINSAEAEVSVFIQSFFLLNFFYL